MAFRTHYVQAARLDDLLVTSLPFLANGFDIRTLTCLGDLSVEVAAKHYVGTATGHVRCDRN
jgi:hypothetical protein